MYDGVVSKQFKSRLSLYVSLDRIERRNVTPIGFDEGVLTVAIPVHFGKKADVYTALAYLSKQVVSRINVHKTSTDDYDREIGATIGEISHVYFEDGQNGRYMMLSVPIYPKYVEAFYQLTVFE